MRCTGCGLSRRSFSLLPGCAGLSLIWAHRFLLFCHGRAPFLVLQLQVYQTMSESYYKTTKEPRTKQAIPPTETAAQYKERSPPWPFDLNYQRGLLSLFSLCSEVRITPHHENGLCISISSGARFCPLKRLKPLPQQGFHGLHLFQQP